MITTLRIVHDEPRLLSSFKGPRNPPLLAVLSQPFPFQQQAQLVIHDQPSPSNTSYVLMCTSDSKQNDITLTNRAKDYSFSKEKVDAIPPSLVQPSPVTPPTNGPLHLKRMRLDTILRPPPKGVVRKSAFNPRARAAQNYSIVKDIDQALFVMSALQFLQICPIQWKTLLKSIGGIDPTDTDLIIFDLEDHIPRLPPQLTFQIQVIVSGDLSLDPFHVIFPTDEMIMSVMSMEDTPWDNGHHRSILFLEQCTIEGYQRLSTPSTVVIISTVPESTHNCSTKGT
jgi:hypothetical protein